MSNKTTRSVLGHEKLRVYQQALVFVSWKEDYLARIAGTAIALDHLDRAADSVVEAIANGNSRRAVDDRNRYFDVALGSALECAACLDVCARKQLLSREQQGEGKGLLLPVVRMAAGLRAARRAAVREHGQPYDAGKSVKHPLLFSHESLVVYQRSLDLVGWLDDYLRRESVNPRHASALDKSTTSLVLNIAEGNGRSSPADHRRFLDIALTCAMNTAARLDLLVAKRRARSEKILDGKQVLDQLVPLLFGLRGYLDETNS